MTTFWNLKCYESMFVRDVRIILFVMKKGFQLNAGKGFFNVLLNVRFVDFLEMRTKFEPLLRTDLSESESRKYSGIVNYSFEVFKR